ncbi:MAG: helix-turn-helix transcriptional regulator, partial [Actinomycetota bacterium]|nr:helix-turn-helix transcriptional regulator [Actinomycetota bacterium]
PGSAPVPATVPARDGGWATLHADRLATGNGEPQVSVVIEAARRERLTDVVARCHGLTPREREIASLVLRGASTKAIGAALHLSAWTVQDHLKSIFAKTGVRTRGELSALMLGAEAA